MSLEIKNLEKAYKNGVKALDKVSLTIPKGMFGLLGPNGAGKSTLMRTVATLQSPDKGEIFFEGIDVLKDPMSLRRILGYLPQEFGVYPKVSGERLLNYFANLKGISSKSDRSKLIGEILELTNLTEVRKKYVSGYSGGMKQRFGIAQLLLNNPKLIIVDEPTAGLDPAERVRFLNILREIGSRNTVIFSTHIVEDVKDLCHEVAIMNGGRILHRKSPVNAVNAIDGRVWTTSIKSEDLDSTKEKHQILSSSYNRDDSINIRIYSENHPGGEFIPAKPQLDDVYFLILKEASETPTLTI
ncbi:MAG: ABC transporter ATP-binding protein [Bacteroidota bacterium]